MHFFYTQHVNADIYELTKEESKHCCMVLRKKQGDAIYLVDGKGTFFVTEILDDNPKKTSVKIIEKVKNYKKRNYNLHLAIAPTKNISRFEWFLEKATEIGIDEITPIISNRSERKHLNLERMNKILISAMKQSLKAHLPKINKCIKFKDFIAKCNCQRKLIAHCGETVKTPLQKKIKINENSCILIGPEGDFTKEEVELAKQNRFDFVSLGENRLRTETAGIYSCSIVNMINQ